ERALIATVLQNVAAGVISLDADGLVFTCNDAALAMLRQRPEDVLGKPAAETWSDEQRVRLAAMVSAPLQSPPAARELRLEHAWLDGEQFRRALINLLDNAVEATPPPGRVHVDLARRGGVLEMRVADTGPGIAPEARGKLFLPYYSTKGRGTGLGLAIVHRIVQDHHGTIRVEDNVPQGSVFVVELPQT